MALGALGLLSGKLVPWVEKKQDGLVSAAGRYGKLGLLLLNDGVWKSTQGQEKRILSQQWVEQMTTTQMEGIQVPMECKSGPCYRCFCYEWNVGQYVYCIPQNNTVIVLCSGSNNVFAQSPVLQLLQEYFASEHLLIPFHFSQRKTAIWKKFCNGLSLENL